MRSAICDHKFLLAVVFRFTLLVPLTGLISSFGNADDGDACVDEIVPDRSILVIRNASLYRMTVYDYWNT